MSTTRTARLLCHPCILCTEFIAFLAASLSPAFAGEQEMRAALARISQQEAEYRAALSLATTDEQRASIIPPSTDEAAAALWKSVRTKTGTKEVPVTPPASLRKAENTKPSATRQAPTYEFEEDWAAPAVVWLLSHPDALAGLFPDAPQKLAHTAHDLLDSVLNKHYSSPLVAELCPRFAENTDEQVYDVIKKIYEKNEDPTARGAAALAMSIMLSNPSLAAEEGGQAQIRAKRIFLIRQALNTSPEDASFGNASLTEVAQEQIYRIRRLSVGVIPPQVTLTAPDGTPSVFPSPGKHTLLFFWSPAEDVGLTVMQKQQALLKRYPDLVVCPIVQHMEPEQLNAMLKEQEIAVSYADDTKGTAATAYRIRQLPHAVLLSPSCRILFTGYPDMQLQTALDRAFTPQQKEEKKSSVKIGE